MGVLMVRAVHMGVFVIHLLMPVVMFVTLGQVQPDAPGHEGRGSQEPEGDVFPEQDDAHQAAHKGRHGKIGPGAGRADMPQRPDEQHQAGAVPQKAQETGKQGDSYLRKNAGVPGGDCQVSSPRRESLDHGNLYRVPQGNFPGEIVIQTPGQAGPGHSQRTPEGGDRPRYQSRPAGWPRR